jgi:hypothetical protein
MNEYHYFLKEGDGPERQVTKAEYVAAERAAGFYNRIGQPAETATGRFGADGISGRQVWTSG